MWGRLTAYWVYGGAIFSLVLLALMPIFRPALNQGSFLALLCLPIYAMHQLEEHDDNRFVNFVNARLPAGRRGLTMVDSFCINVFGVWFLIAAAVWLTQDTGLQAWALVPLFLLLVNAAVHMMAAILLRESNPGLWTAMVLFLPYGVWATSQIWAAATPLQIAFALGFIIILHLLVNIQAMRPREE